MKYLEGKAVVVTGAGRGIGAAIATHAAAAGASVVVNDIDLDMAIGVAERIVASGGSAVAHGADIRQPEAAEDLIDLCIRSFARIDGLVNNAGIFSISRLEDETAERLQQILAVNVVGAFNCTKAAIRRMYAQGNGSIVNVVSGAQAGIELMSAYGASKGALAAMTYAAAIEARGTGVRINAISPIGATRMTETLNSLRRAQGKELPSSPPPEANAPVVAYLLSDSAEAVHGQVVRIDGTRISLMSHPTIVEPVYEADGWNLDKVDALFKKHLTGSQLPLGLPRDNHEPVKFDA